MNHGTVRHTLRVGAMILGFVALTQGGLQAQDTSTAATRVPPPRPAASRLATRLLVVFRPPARGVRRERALTRGGDGARALLPSVSVDTMIPQTIRDAPVVAVCAAGQPDSAWLRVKVGETINDVMIELRPGLNRIALGAAKVPLNDGDVAEWSLATRSGQVFLQEFIQRRVARIAPTVNALASNGVWYDALDLFALQALRRGVPLSRERLDLFVTSVGETPCPWPPDTR